MGDLPRIDAGVAVNVGSALREPSLCIDIDIDIDVDCDVHSAPRFTRPPHGASEASAISQAVLL